jgi:hypothetical protein
MKGSQESLTTVVVKSWPTPAARDHKDTGENVDMKKVAAKCKLSGVVAVHGLAVPASGSTDGSRRGLWATPDASDRRSDKSRQVGLSNQMKSETWPTPASSGVTGGPTGLAGGAGNREKLASMLPDAEAKAMGCGKLNPRWVEILIGVPVGWTMPSCASPVTIERMNSDSSETVLSQQQQNEPSEH